MILNSFHNVTKFMYFAHFQVNASICLFKFRFDYKALGNIFVSFVSLYVVWEVYKPCKNIIIVLISETFFPDI